ncbi:MAG: aspartate aminotransferase family protein [Thermoflavifilum sp.]|nr:aspartate aminotransferase family protein [Thermoflavifilum sp.]
MRAEGGRVWAYLYDSGLHHAEAVAREAFMRFQALNALDFTVFPSLLRLENETVQMTAARFHPGPDTVGTFTSGGTESIMLAVKAARDWFRDKRPGVAQPEMVIPVTAHAAFHKAAHWLGLRLRILPVDPVTFTVDPAAVEAAITPETCLIVASAVNYSHGVMDPIEELGRIAERHGVWLHVDACIGGFLLHDLARLGETVPAFDFQVPGVTSLSVDLHKYAYAPKGASVVLFRTRDFRKYQYFACTRWSGYPVLNTTLQSTKSGGPLAGAWAVLHAIGDEGYLQLAKRVLEIRKRLERDLPQRADVRVLGRPQAGLLALASDTIHLFVLADEMRRRGWYVQVQPGRPEYGLDPSLHLTVTPVRDQHLDEFLADFAEAARRTASSQGVDVNAVLSRMEFAQADVDAVLTAAGVGPEGLPQDMAAVNTLLRVLPPELTEQLFIHLANTWFR